MPNPLRIFGRKRFRQSVLKTLHATLVSVLVLQSVFIGGFAFSRSAQAAELQPESAVVSELSRPSPTPTPLANPGLPNGGSCGVNLALSVDISGSVESGEMTAMKTALKSFTSSFIGTPTSVSLSTFATNSDLLSPLTTNIASINGHIDGLPAQGNDNTNWQSGLARAQSTLTPGATKPNVILIATDGSPNRYGYPTANGFFDWTEGLNHAITQANIAKTAGTRIVVLAIGGDPVDPSYPNTNFKLQGISGPTIATTPAAITTATDIIKVTDFTGIGEAISSYATALCGGSLTVTKVVDEGSATPDQFGFRIVGSQNPYTYPASGQNTVNFGNLVAGSYSIEETGPDGYHQVSSTCDQVAVTANTIATCTIHNTKTMPRTGMIHGTKMDSHEHGLQNWQICYAMSSENDTLSTTGETPVTCTTTDAQGHYAFMDVPFGTYNVWETMQSGWTPVSPTNGQYTYQTLSLKDPVLELNFQNRQLQANLSIQKDDDRTTVLPGQTVTYDIPVSNSGMNNAINTVVTDTLPAHVSYVSSTIDGTPATPTITGSTVTWSLGTIAIEQTKVIRLTVQFSSTFPYGTTAVTNHVSVTTDTPETTTEDNHAMDTDTVTTTAVLGLQKTGPATVQAGQNMTYTLNWSVSGTAAVTQAIISDPFPANTTFVSQTCGTTVGTCVVTQDASHIVWNLGTRAQGEHGTVTVTVKTSAALANGVILTNTANFDSEETPAVQSSAVTTVLATTPGSPILSITKSNNVSIFTNPGQTVTYTVVVKNSALATASAVNVMMTDTLPAGFTFVDTGLSSKVLALGTIAPGNSVTLTYDVLVSTTISSGNYINTASAKGENTDAVSASSTVAIRVPEVLGATTEPSLTLTKTVNVTKAVASGSIVTYTVTIKNTGDLVASNVVLDDTLPTGFTFLVDGSSHKIWNLGTIKPDHSRVIMYDVKISNSVTNGVYKNVAVLNADGQPSLKAQATVTIQNPKVLGLAATGANSFDKIVLALSGLAFLVGASLVIRNQRGYRTS